MTIGKGIAIAGIWAAVTLVITLGGSDSGTNNLIITSASGMTAIIALFT